MLKRSLSHIISILNIVHIIMGTWIQTMFLHYTIMDRSQRKYIIWIKYCALTATEQFMNRNVLNFDMKFELIITPTPTIIIICSSSSSRMRLKPIARNLVSIFSRKNRCDVHRALMSVVESYLQTLSSQDSQAASEARMSAGPGFSALISYYYFRAFCAREG